MTVKELKIALNGFDDDLEIMTKKTEILGNVGYVNSVRKDSYIFLGYPCPCVLLTDEDAENEGKG